MIKKQIKIINKLGLHARPSSKLAELCNKFKSNIWILKEGEKVSAKNMMDVLMLALSYESKITIFVEGKDESEAFLQIKNLFVSRFGEEE
jgi:phosphocarrier protein